MKPDELGNWELEGLKRLLSALNEYEETGTLKEWETEKEDVE